MNMNKITSEILNSINLSKSVKIYFVNPTQQNESESYQIAKLNINKSVAKAVKRVVKSTTKTIKDCQKISIDKIDKDDEDYVLTIPLKQIENLGDYLKLIKQEKFRTFNAHKCEDYLANLKFYIVQIQINKKEYFFLKRYSATKLLAPRQVMLFLKENTFEHIEDDKVFVLENSFDAFIHNDTVYLLNEKQFSLMTGYWEKEKTKATTLLDDLEDLSLISNFSEVRDFCMERISYVKRLSKKVDKTLLTKITYEKIKKLKADRGLDFSLDHKAKKITCENNTQIRDMIDLILDNFVISEVTEERYRALNKTKDSKTA